MRFIGNKESMLDSIESLIIDKKINKKCFKFFDAFCGTGTVSSYFSDIFDIIINDNLYSSYIYSYGRLNKSKCTFEILGFNPIEYFNSNEDLYEGFFTKNYSPSISGRSYFSDFNAGRIDFIRMKIDEWKNSNLISNIEYAYLISCLLESISKVANVAGVYGACLKIWDPRALKKIIFIEPTNYDKNIINDVVGYNDDIKNIISNVECDILYLDPPYTKNKYPVQYHILETLALNDNPQIKGVTGCRDYSHISTDWSKINAVEINFDYVVANTKAKYIIVSYSNDGIMSKEFITETLKRYGKEDTFELREINYKKYRNIKTVNKKEHFEYLFYIEKKNQDEVIYTCPINYMGGKTMMINYLKPYFANGSNQFVDLMAGGFNVGINVNNSNTIIYNDYNYIVKDLVSVFAIYDTKYILDFIDKTIKKYNLIKADKESFVNYRALWNESLSKAKDKYLYLYVLILFGFQQQLRFNSKMEFNNTVGMSSYNESTKAKIVSFSRKIKEMNVEFYALDYEELEDKIDDNATIYVDPPYLITLGSYNDGKRGFKGWNEYEEKRLYSFLSKMLKKHCKIVISNVIEHKEKTNQILLNWINENNLNINKTEIRGRKEMIISNE